MRVLRASAWCLAAGLIPTVALAQTAPAGVAADAGPVPDASGPQLGPDEQLYPIGDGQCAAIDRKSSHAAMIEFYRTSAWFGACRFGLADGNGYLRRPDKLYYPNRFHHGIRPVVLGKITDWAFAAQDNYLPGQARTVVQMKTAVGLAGLGFGNDLDVSTYYDASWRHTQDLFSTGTFNCPYRGLLETLPILDKRFERDARSLCGRNGRAGYDGNPLPAYVAHYRKEYDASTEQLVPATAARPNPVIVEVAVCLYPPGSTPCQAAYQKLLAPFRERIERTIAGDAAAQAAVAAVDARYAPLQAAEAARLRAIASRIAGQVPIYSVPPAPQVRAAVPARKARP